MACVTDILGSIDRDCDAINASIGVERDMWLVDYDDFDRLSTIDVTNYNVTDVNEEDYSELINIIFNVGYTTHKFEGTDYSIVPTVTAEIRDDGDAHYMHSIEFIAYSKIANARAVLQSLAGSRYVAICKDKSSGKYELFGADQGLKVSEINRVYVGEQNSNFYTVTIATPDIAVMREGNLGWLADSFTPSV